VDADVEAHFEDSEGDFSWASEQIASFASANHGTTHGGGTSTVRIHCQPQTTKIDDEEESWFSEASDMDGNSSAQPSSSRAKTGLKKKRVKRKLKPSAASNNKNMLPLPTVLPGENQNHSHNITNNNFLLPQLPNYAQQACIDDEMSSSAEEEDLFLANFDPFGKTSTFVPVSVAKPSSPSDNHNHTTKMNNNTSKNEQWLDAINIICKVGTQDSHKIGVSDTVQRSTSSSLSKPNNVNKSLPHALLADKNALASLVAAAAIMNQTKSVDTAMQNEKANGRTTAAKQKKTAPPNSLLSVSSEHGVKSKKNPSLQLSSSLRQKNMARSCASLNVESLLSINSRSSPSAESKSLDGKRPSFAQSNSSVQRQPNRKLVRNVSADAVRNNATTTPKRPMVHHKQVRPPHNSFSSGTTESNHGGQTTGPRRIQNIKKKIMKRSTSTGKLLTNNDKPVSPLLAGQKPLVKKRIVRRHVSDELDLAATSTHSVEQFVKQEPSGSNVTPPSGSKSRNIAVPKIKGKPVIVKNASATTTTNTTCGAAATSGLDQHMVTRRPKQVKKVSGAASLAGHELQTSKKKKPLNTSLASSLQVHEGTIRKKNSGAVSVDGLPVDRRPTAVRRVRNKSATMERSLSGNGSSGFVA
jgi:hypothetical protein